MSRFKRILITLFMLALVAGACTPITPPEPVAAPQPDIAPNILFIGSNLTGDNLGVDQHIQGLAASANPSSNIETSSFVPQPYGDGDTTPGSLGYHWNDGLALDEIHNGGWDVVVLQEHNRTILFDLPAFFEYTRNFNEEIRLAGAEPVLFMPWVHHAVVTIDQLAQAYGDIGAELDVKVAPVGLAWERSMGERPDLELYKNESWKIANLRGTYLTTCVLFATIFERSPEGLSYRPADLLSDEDSASQLLEEWLTVEAVQEAWQITEDEAEFLQRIAWETVQEYEGAAGS